MIISKEELHETLVRIICDDWNEKEKVANMFVGQLFTAANEGGSVADINGMFNKHYICASPVDEAEMWKYMFNIKALFAWEGEDIPAKLARLEDEAVCNWVILDADAVEGSREKVRVERLSLEEQAAIFYELEKNHGYISPYFYENLVRVYPNLIEAYLFYLDFALPKRQFDCARKALAKLEETYPCDFRLLKRRLDLFQNDGTVEEVSESARKAVEFLDTNCNKPGFDLAHYAGQIQLSAKDYAGAVETYGFLLTNWMLLDPIEVNERRSLLSLFFDICRIPAGYLEEKIMLFTVQYTFILRAIIKAGVDMDERENASMLGNTIVQMSSQLANPVMRIPFQTILEFCEEMHLLSKDGFERVIETGHQALESHGIGEDSSMRDDIRDILLALYNGADQLNADQMENLFLYFNISAPRKSHLKKNYPIIAGIMEKAFADYAKKSKKSAKNPYGESTAPIMRSTKKVGRNDPCPCGSGKKYKQCCGK